jgi:hypothetical protein
MILLLYFKNEAAVAPGFKHCWIRSDLTIKTKEITNKKLEKTCPSLFLIPPLAEQTRSKAIGTLTLARSGRRRAGGGWQAQADGSCWCGRRRRWRDRARHGTSAQRGGRRRTPARRDACAQRGHGLMRGALRVPLPPTFPASKVGTLFHVSRCS